MQKDFLDFSTETKAKNLYSKLLRYHNLSHLYETDVIYNEVFLSYKKFCDAGGEIEELEKWVMIVGKNRIKDLVKQDIKARELVNNVKFIAGYINEEQNSFSQLYQALQILKNQHPDDYKLVCIHFFSKASWRKIAAFCLEKSESEVLRNEEDRYRKQGCRAIKKLRKIYFQLLCD